MLHDEVAVLVVSEDTNQQETTTAVDSSSIINSNLNSNNNNNNNNDIDIDISTPKFIKFNSTTDVAYKPVVDVASKDLKIQEKKSLKRIMEAGNLKSQHIQTI